MDFLLAVFLISTVYFITSMVWKIVSLKHGKMDRSQGDDRILQLELALRRVEQRLQNVETIVTGKDYHLYKAFENLEQDSGRPGREYP